MEILILILIKKNQINSQEDLFAEPKKVKVKYEFVVLCDKDDAEKHPFASYPRNMFSTKEIMDKWLYAILDDSSRLRTIHTLQGIGDKQFSLFGKFEEGKLNIKILEKIYSLFNYHFKKYVPQKYMASLIF